MRRIMIRYKVKPGQAELNEELVRAVYDELHRTQPDGFHYATLQLDDGVSFVHLATQETDVNPLTENEAFQRFQENIRDRLEEGPVVTDVREIGSFRFFGE